MNQTQFQLGDVPPTEIADLIDLLVERELSSDRRQALIEKLDRQPELWRLCALAFMERDALGATLVQIARKSEPGLPLHVRPASLVENKPTVPLRRLTSNRIVPTAVWTAAAIVLLAIGFGLGWLQRPSLTTARNEDLNENVNPPVDNFISVELTRNDPAVWLQVSNAVNRLSVSDGRVVALLHVARGNAPTEILPIIQSHQLAEQVIASPRPRLSRDLVDQVQRAGWELDTTRQFLSLHLPDGENRVLPVDTLNYRYIGNEIF